MSAYTYDFGVNIARGFVSELARTTLSVSALVGSMYALMQADTEYINTMKRNQVAFGGYVNALKMMQWTADKIASGKAPFEQDDLIAGARSLQRAGIDVRKNFDLIAKSADAIGGNFSDIAEVVRTGNFSALAEAGIITDRMAISMERWGYTAQQSSQKVLSILKEAERRNMFENTIKSIPQIMLRFKQFGKEFLRAIVGDPKDPNGFMYGIRKTLTEVADFMYKSLEKLKKVGAMIGAFLRFVVDVSYDFMKRVWRNVSSLLSINDKFWENFAEKLRSFQLWLAIARAKINKFFDDYGKQIKTIIKILLILRGINFALGIITSVATAIRSLAGLRAALSAVLTVAEVLFGRTLTAIMVGLGNGVRMALIEVAAAVSSAGGIIAVLKGAFASLGAVIMATPVGWLIAAIASVIAIGYLLWKNWDSLRDHWREICVYIFNIAKVIWNLIVITISLAVQAVVGLIKGMWTVIRFVFWDGPKFLLTKLWQLIKFIFTSVYNFVAGVFRSILDVVKSVLGPIWTDYLEPLANSVKAVFSSVYDSIAGFFNGIYNKAVAIIDKVKQKWADFKGWFSDIFSSDNVAKAANATGTYADSLSSATFGVPVGLSGTDPSAARNADATDRAERMAPANAPNPANYTPVPNNFKAPVGVSMDDMASASKKVVNVHAGAIQINASGMSVEQIKKLIREVLSEPDNKYR